MVKSEKNKQDKVEMTIVWKGKTYSVYARIEEIAEFDADDKFIKKRRRTKEELKYYLYDATVNLIKTILPSIN